MAKHHIHHITITPAENGFSAEVRKNEPTPKKGQAPVPYDELTEQHVFPHINHVADFLKKTFGADSPTSERASKTSSKKLGGSQLDTYEAGGTED